MAKSSDGMCALSARGRTDRKLRQRMTARNDAGMENGSDYEGL